MREIISNASCLIALMNIGRLTILHELYGHIVISPEVAREVGDIAEPWIEIREVKDQQTLKALASIVDMGEAGTLALAMEHKEAVAVLDDLKARRLATELNVPFTGLMGVLLKTKENGIIAAVGIILTELKQAGFRISTVMENEVLRLAQE
ncbi:MAG: DUF3368 domain-containing protein [Lentisphaerae bacterium]|nr:DUF3368 domain-containing protein [Lentisphaerota bacterium]